jgi:hypothetical protein
MKKKENYSCPWYKKAGCYTCRLGTSALCEAACAAVTVGTMGQGGGNCFMECLSNHCGSGCADCF